jgi:hypothetical protein
MNDSTFLPKVNPLRRWFVFLGGGIAWTIHLLSIYVIGEFGCVSGLGQLSFANISYVAWMILGISLLLLATTLIAAVVGYIDTKRDVNRENSQIEDEGGVYLSKFGFILNVLFIIIIIFETLPVFAYLDGC